ncbi:hypothetical protein L218DRAFT_130359 [Marasmius fiardii PR-910]|nr:hypothetical protein L218DRAFT_130359 [Marasmius fiardii PR-910]
MASTRACALTCFYCCEVWCCGLATYQRDFYRRFLVRTSSLKQACCSSRDRLTYLYYLPFTTSNANVPPYSAYHPEYLHLDLKLPQLPRTWSRRVVGRLVTTGGMVAILSKRDLMCRILSKGY